MCDDCDTQSRLQPGYLYSHGRAKPSVWAEDMDAMEVMIIVVTNVYFTFDGIR